MSSGERETLRDLARRYVEICANDVQRERRRLWRRHNSLKPTRPLIYVRAFAWREMPESQCVCEDPFLRGYEGFFRRHLLRDTFEDDSIFEPWVTLRAACQTPPGGIWGVPIRWIGRAPGMAGVLDPPIREPEDAGKMVQARHVIDENATEERRSKLHEVMGDIIEINVDRGPIHQSWYADISTMLGQIRGLDQVMWDMMDRPDWLHEVLAFMRDGILKTHREAEQAADWGLCNHQNQAMSYAEELEDPRANIRGVSRERLWCFCASQEYAHVGPKLFWEFMLQYQLEIIRHFGLVAYGCCEDLTRMIPLLREHVPNLRRIAVSPMADVATCAEQIGSDYVISYRPSPSDMVGYGFDEERIRRILRRDLAVCRDKHVDITLKDVETVQEDPTRVPRWVRITREVIDELWG